MLSIFLLLLVRVINAESLKSDGSYPPHYVQARNAFIRAKLFLHDSVPYEARHLRDPEASKHFQFGIIAGVTIALVKAFDSTKEEYRPLKVMQGNMPKTWAEYRAVSRHLNRILVDASNKISQFTTVIDEMCATSSSVEACNLEVHEHVINHRFLKQRARFLLQLGKAATIINKHTKKIEEVATANKAIPYLYRIADTTNFEVFIAELTRCLELMRPGVRKLKRELHSHL